MEHWKKIITNKSNSLYDLSFQQPIILVFLRHFGCVFCKKNIDEISEVYTTVSAKGIRIIFVHMTNEDTADNYFNRFGLHNVESISDPKRLIYKKFGLKSGTISQLYGLSTFTKGFKLMKDGYGQEVEKKLGNIHQMPGFFVLWQSEIKHQYIPKKVSSELNIQQIIEHAQQFIISK